MYTYWERRNKIVFVCRWHDHLHRISERAHKIFLELINDYRKVAGYKVNIQKSVTLPYTSTEIKNPMLFTLAYKNFKFLGINKICTRIVIVCLGCYNKLP